MNTTTQKISKKFAFPTIEVLLLLVAAFWGTSYGMTKSALLFTGVFVFMAIRFLLTFSILFFSTVKDFRAGRNKDWKVSIPTGGILLAIFCCEIIGVSITSATNAAFLISLSVILTAFLELMVNKQRLSRQLLMLSLICVLGVYLLTYDGSLSLSLNTGDWLILTAALLRGLMVTTTKRFTENREITSLSLTALQSLVVGLGAVVLVFTYGQGLTLDSIPNSMEFWLITLYLVLFCTLFAFFVQNYAVRRTSPTKVSILMGSEPLFGAIFAVLWLGESLNVVQCIGGAAIVGSVLIATLRKNSN
ncbi:MAG: DMT family transporter [Photobacterium aquimaris]|nr:DMT family transporter [Photobacterium aquimaris]